MDEAIWGPSAQAIVSQGPFYLFHVLTIYVGYLFSIGEASALVRVLGYSPFSCFLIQLWLHQASMLAWKHIHQRFNVTMDRSTLSKYTVHLNMKIL